MPKNRTKSQKSANKPTRKAAAKPPKRVKPKKAVVRLSGY
jgi:hypothetical protein